MSVFHNNILAGASGASGAGEATYVDDVFSTFLYEGNNGSQTITNGIDLDGEGGLVWVKGRTSSYNNIAMDTERGATSSLKVNSSASAETLSTRISGFTSTGFTVGSNANVNASDNDYVSWSFRKAPGFFDVVTYTGNGSNRTIAHNLGSVPGFIIIKAINDSRHWWCFHRSIGNTKAIALSLTATPTTAQAYWNNTSPTDTVFTVGTDADVNQNNTNYVAYLFAHDDQSFGTDSDEAIIKCGGYTGNGSVVGPEQDLGFQPQWVMIKSASSVSDHWCIFDMMRGIVSDSSDNFIQASSSSSEQEQNLIQLETSGFRPRGSDDKTNKSGASYIYVAIRHPHKPPATGTDVFTADAAGLNAQAGQKTFDADHYVDLVLQRQKNSSASGFQWFDRVRGGGKVLKSNNTNAELSQTSVQFFDIQDGVKADASGGNFSSWVGLMFKRAPEFFDIVAYTGNGTNNHQESHNLTVRPELAIFKERDDVDSWVVFFNMNASTYSYAFLESSGSAGTQSYGSGFRMAAQPSATTLFLADYNSTNQSSKKYIAYLFATLPGISKIGTYSGSSSAVTVDCGFSSGPRFLMIKATNRSEPWYVFDSARGIVSGNDPHLQLNTTSTENDGDDVIDPTSSGFTVNTGYGSGFNESGNTYLFFAIA